VPGAALDVGCAEGADAIWLAERGWHVAAVDFSMVALGRARVQAIRLDSDVAKRIIWLHANLTDYVPEPASFNLVSTQFMDSDARAIREVPAGPGEPAARARLRAPRAGGHHCPH